MGDQSAAHACFVAHFALKTGGPADPTFAEPAVDSSGVSVASPCCFAAAAFASAAAAEPQRGSARCVRLTGSTAREFPLLYGRRCGH
jgi:hypothetical protein